jgi:hypothetical protein
MRQRFCSDCGAIYEAVSDDDWWCKQCLIRRYQFAAEFGVDYHTITFEDDDPPMTPNGPGGS